MVTVGYRRLHVHVYHTVGYPEVIQIMAITQAYSVYVRNSYCLPNPLLRTCSGSLNSHLVTKGWLTTRAASLSTSCSILNMSPSLGGVVTLASVKILLYPDLVV